MSSTSTSTPRDLTGAGNHPPQARWPKGARVALNFHVIYDEGAEYNGLDDDVGGPRDLMAESAVEFGSRCGFWRWHRLFVAKKVPATVSVAGLALQRNVSAAGALKEAMAEKEWEVASCGWRKYAGYVPYGEADADGALEKEDLNKTIKLHQDLLGKRPFGFGTDGHPTLSTRKNVIQEGGFLYDMDSTADELPYWIMPSAKGDDDPVGGALNGRPHLIIPFSPMESDEIFVEKYNHDSAQFLKHLTDTLRFFYDEARANSKSGNHCKMMTVTLHSRFARPALVQAVSDFIDVAKGYGSSYVWICTREQIANHWYEHHLPRGVGSPIKPHQIQNGTGSMLGSAMSAMGLGSSSSTTPTNSDAGGNDDAKRFSFLPNLTKAREPEPELDDSNNTDDDQVGAAAPAPADAAADEPAGDDDGDII